MRSFIAFTKKELSEHIRSGKLLILSLLFILFGIMNPAVAKLTPWLLDVMSESLAGSGITVTDVTISALDSWVQFFKNIPIALTVFVLLESNIFTKEYNTGTLILSLTKGLSRYKVLIAKASVMLTLWTVGYLLCFIITYGYNAYFWDNSVAQELSFAAVSWWIFGLWVIALTVIFSTVSASNITVLAGCGGCVLLSYVIGFIPKASKYLPTFLTDGNSLIYGLSERTDHLPALFVTLILTAVLLSISIPLFNRKQM